MKIEKWNSCQSKYPFWHLPTPRVSFIVHTKMNKKSNNHHDLKDCSLEVISTLYADHLQIYTDGSKQSNDSTGAAFYIPELNIKKYAKISPISIARAELSAIILALEWLDNLISLKVVILSDSLSALQAISSYKYEQSLVLEILYLLKHLERKRINVYFEWIPSHIGLHGNDVADQLANKATKRKCIDFDIPKNRKEHMNMTTNTNVYKIGNAYGTSPPMVDIYMLYKIKSTIFIFLKTSIEKMRQPSTNLD